MTIKSKLKARLINARKTAKLITQQSINKALKKMQLGKKDQCNQN